MDIKNVNINNLYSAVRNVGNNDTQILEPLGGGGWQIGQVKDLTPEQKEQNRKFRNGLYDSLKGLTSDDSVIKDLRNALGLPEKANENEDKKADADKPLMARDIKKAIELVMRRVDERIDAVLTTKFPPAVQQLIREAVRENPQHAIVKAFLRAEKGTVDDLAKLCRLTFQSLKGGAADPSALAYLDGFAYKVADFENVQRVSDSQQYAAGVSHYEKEVKAQAEKLKEQPAKKAQIDKETQPDKEGIAKNKKDAEGKKIDNGDVKNDENVKNDEIKPQPIQEVKQEDPKKPLSEDVQKLRNALIALHKDKLSDDLELLKFIEDKCAETLSRYKSTCRGLVGVNQELVTDEEMFSIFAREIDNKWKSAGLSPNTDEVLKKAYDDALVKCERFIRFRTAVEDVKEKIEAEKNKAVDQSELATKAKSAFLTEIEGLKSLGADGDVYRLMSVKLTSVKDVEKKNGEDMRKALKETLEGILQRGVGLLDVPSLKKEPKGLKLVEKDGLRLDSHTKIRQGNGTNLCYLRCIENGLIANEDYPGLPKPDKEGTYTFRVDVGGTKADKSVLTVTKDEIAKLKKWYDVNLLRHQTDMGLTGKLGGRSFQVKHNARTKKYEKYSPYESQKASFSDLDWAINLALAKRAMWQDAQKDVKQNSVNMNVSVAAPAPLILINEFSGETKLAGGYGGKSYQTYLENQLITSPAKDTEVAEFFGLTDDDNIAINHRLIDGTSEMVEEPRSEDLFAQWNRVRKWKAENPNGILTLNESNRHFVSVQDFYYESDTDFGFIVRDSNKDGGETKVKIQGYVYDGAPEEGKCHTLHVHCFKQGA